MNLSELKYTLYYLTNDKIYKVVLPDQAKAELVYSPSEPNPGQQFQLNALRCSPDGTLVFQMADLTMGKMIIVAYNSRTKALAPLVDLGHNPVKFPSLSVDGSQVAMAGRNSFIIKDLRKGTIQYYDQFADPPRQFFPWSWSSDGLLALSKGGPGMKSIIYFFDRAKNTLNPWKEGGQAHFSPSGRLVAYLSGNSNELIASDREGKPIHSFNKYFVKDVNGWIGEDKILFTIGVVAYVNHIGIADLRTKKIYDIEVPTSGEIRGVCVEANYPSK